MKNITIYFPFYNQHNALKFNLELYSSFSEEVRRCFDLLIVDDGSQKEQAFQLVKDYVDILNLNLYKIHVDIPWNQGAANNIAFKESKNEWILKTGIDWIIKEDDLRTILESPLENGFAYFFHGQQVSCYPPFVVCGGQVSPPDIFVLNKEGYWKTGGYNEYLCGNYGDDFEFRPRLHEKIYPELWGLHMYEVVDDQHPDHWHDDPNGGPGCPIQSERRPYSTIGLERNVDINLAKSADPNKPFWTFQNSYTKLI